MLEGTVKMKRKDPTKATQEKSRQVVGCGVRQHVTERQEPPFHHGGRPKDRTAEPGTCEDQPTPVRSEGRMLNSPRSPPSSTTLAETRTFG